jgi:hypothetical protein
MQGSRFYCRRVGTSALTKAVTRATAKADLLDQLGK